MKKLGLLVLIAGIILMAGCAGDDPQGPSGTLSTVTGLDILATSAGRTVNLSWTAVTDDIDGYEVYFKSNGDGEWAALTTITGTTYSHTADNAGTYSVRAYKGDNFSENYATEKGTMPTIIMDDYTIWDNHAPQTDDSGFIFGATSGQTCQASTSNNHDIYCFDGDWTYSPCGFYSGDHEPFGGGLHTDMIDDEGTYGYPAGSEWWPTGYVLAGDVIFCDLSDGHFVKVYVTSVPQHATQPLSYGIVFCYDYQPIEGLYLFTTDSTP